MAEDAEEKKGDNTKGKKGATVVKEVTSMKPGDYTIHLLIQKAKDLEIDDEDVLNVVVEVEVQN